MDRGPGGPPARLPSLPPEFVEALGDRYRLLKLIGAGGMATVYLADDLKHGRRVAVKVLRSEVASAIGPERFLREINIVANLSHPNILPLHDSGEASGLLYFVMPYVEGPNLRRVLEERHRMPLVEAVRIVSEVADALEYAHAQGIVHRDVKPENILLQAGHAVVSDFGIARGAIDSASASVTGDHVVVGTPRYMSPEQRLGVEPLDGRTDVYSLGCVFYEMLTGVPVVTGPSPVRAAIPDHRPLRGLGLRAGAAHRLERAIDDALAPSPSERTPSPAVFAQAIRVPARRWRLTVAVGLAAIVAGGAIVYKLRPSGPELDPERVVVRSFVNQTGDASLDNIGIVAAHWLIEGLQEAPRLKVVPFDRSFALEEFIEKQLLTHRPGRLVSSLPASVGAGTVVSGWYAREGDTLVVYAQVQDQIRGRTLGELEPARGPLGRPLDALSSLRGRLLSLLALTFDDRSLGTVVGVPARPPAYAAYLESVEGTRAYVENDFATALQHFRRASRGDSTFATPLVMESIILSNLGRFAEADSVIKSIFRRQVVLSPYQRDWIEYRRKLMAGDHPGALVAIRRAAAAAPGSKASYNLGVEALQNGRVAEALAALDSLHPDEPPMLGFVSYWDLRGTAHHLLENFAAELKDGDAARESYPTRLFALLPTVRALAALGRTAELDSSVSTAERLPPDPTGYTAGRLLQEAALELLAHGRPDDARRYFARSLSWTMLRRGRDSGSAEERYATAEVLAALGRPIEAAAILDTLLRPPGGGSPAAYLGLRGVIGARGGNEALADSMVRRLEAMPRRYSFGEPTFWLAKIAAARDGRETAVALLRKAFEEGMVYDLWLHRDPELESLRPLAGFQALLRPKG
ncbi:MAG TPA: serine/threonine-protein kinase [Gemmatimonadales bacterium]|jgi:tRNA A-37 threonylcarbamoyl transferase component Bud32/tetratricopeptide (TPR) repeat protein|nr:serine/threonine-protein kinase [Gemmatimonadales bacterium]